MQVGKQISVYVHADIYLETWNHPPWGLPTLWPSSATGEPDVVIRYRYIFHVTFHRFHFFQTVTALTAMAKVSNDVL